MKRNDFLNEINRIFRIALIQKISQMVLRAAWVGGAVYLFCWGTNELWGWLPNQKAWIVISVFFAFVILASIFLYIEPDKRFVWRLDQYFSLQEQVYTLFEVLEDDDPDLALQPMLQELTRSKHVSALSDVRRELVDKGWRVKEEFEAAIVVLILLMIVYLTSVSSISQIGTGGVINILPVVGVDPSAEQVFAAGIPGRMGTDLGTGIGTSESQGFGEIGELNLNPLEWVQVSQLMQNLGERLRQESATYKLGQALVDENYQQAANQFGNLAENVSVLSVGIQKRIADEFLETAVGLQTIQQGEISNYFQEASAALYEGTESKIFEEMDDLASLMELFSQLQSRDPRAELDPNSTPSLIQTFDQYQNNQLVIEELDDLPDYVSSPSIFNAEGQEIFGESSDFIMPFDSTIIEGVWLPFQFSLEDSDVVSSYFSPR